MAAVLVLFAGTNGAAATRAPLRPATQAAAPLVAPDTIRPIQHVVLIMQENHSFDNVLGRFCAEVAAKQIVRPGDDTGCAGATTGKRSNGTVVTLAAAPDVVSDSNHNVKAQTADIASGEMNGFDSSTGSCPLSWLSCYNQYDPLAGTCTSGTNTHATCIPYLGALATKYTIAEQVFELAGAPSWGGHLYAAAATLDGFAGNNPTQNTLGFPLGQGWGCDSGRVSAWGPPPTTKIPSCVPDSTGSLGPVWNGYTGPKADYVPTIFDRLDAAKLSWKLYAGTGPPSSSNTDSKPSGWV
jgi:phospholipase C